MADHDRSYRVRPARPAEIHRLREIEDEAGTLFDGLGLIDEALDANFPLDELLRLVHAGQVWVAVDRTDRPVGMVIASVRDHAAYVEELDVLPAHGRRGLGGRLLARVGAWAQERGYPAVTLSTFRDVPWNGPFYRRQGFRDLTRGEWSPGMPAIRAAEERHGLRVDARVFMRRDLPPGDGSATVLALHADRPPDDAAGTGRRGEVAVVASALAFGVGTAMSVLALRGLRPADLLVVELGGSAFVLLAVAGVSGRLRRTGSLRALAQGALTPGLGFLLGDLGLARTSAASGSLLLGTETLLTVLLAVVVLRERVGRTAAAALALGLAGTLLVALAGVGTADARPDSAIGNLLVIAAVACGAAFTVWSRRAHREAGEGIALTAWQFAGATVAVSPFVAGSWATGGTRLTSADPIELVAAGLVLVCGLGGLLAFNIGIRTVTATRAALLANLQPVAGTATAVAVLGEAVGAGQAVGGGLVLAGVTLLLARHADADATPVPNPSVAADRAA